MLLQIVHIPLLLVELDGWKSGENGTVAAPFKLLAVADMVLLSWKQWRNFIRERSLDLEEKRERIRRKENLAR